MSDTGDALKTIEGYIVTVNQHMDSIATSAREQAVGLAEVNTAVNQMDQVTQQNAAMVEETSAAGATLASESGWPCSPPGAVACQKAGRKSRPGFLRQCCREGKLIGTLMSDPRPSTVGATDTLEIIAFRLHDQEFCVRTTTIREIRGWGPATPIPHAPADVISMMNSRGAVIPIVDLANKLGMKSTEPNERSAIVFAEVHGMAMGLVVDRVSDILTISESLLQAVRDISIAVGML